MVVVVLQEVNKAMDCACICVCVSAIWVQVCQLGWKERRNLVG